MRTGKSEDSAYFSTEGIVRINFFCSAPAAADPEPDRPGREHFLSVHNWRANDHLFEPARQALK